MKLDNTLKPRFVGWSPASIRSHRPFLGNIAGNGWKAYRLSDPAKRRGIGPAVEGREQALADFRLLYVLSKYSLAVLH